MLVVIAEVEQPVAELIAEVVKHVGHTPLVAPSGRLALEVVRERRPALLITSLILPHLDGADLISTLKPERDAGLQTILVTASPTDARRVEATAVLPIPFHIAVLETLLTRLLPIQSSDDLPCS